MDENTTPRRWGRLLTAGIAGAAALGLATAGSAAADTATASANAVTVGVIGTSLISSGTEKAANDGTTTTQTAAVSAFTNQGGVTAGLVTQSTAAGVDGSSAACAGLVGAGGTAKIGNDGNCTVTGAASGGVQITLAAGVVIKADAIIAQCTASSTGAPTSKVTLTNAKVLLPLGLPISLASAPTPNTGVTVPGVADLLLHGTSTPAGSGSIQSTALTIKLLGGTVAAVNVGTVTCGPNAKTAPANALPGPAAPLSAAALAVLGWRFRRPVLQALSARSTPRG